MSVSQITTHLQIHVKIHMINFIQQKEQIILQLKEHISRVKKTETIHRKMSNRNFGYYGNNRLQQQTYARNLYINNTNGKTLITNPQTSNGNASQQETYRSGSQTTHSKGLLAGRDVISIGGTQ